MANISLADLKKLFLEGTPLIDVRAPVEFAMGSLPGAVNLPIMDNEQRATVGTTYKKSGREEAIRLGHELVSGAVKESRVQQWSDFISLHPQAVLYCFRGGLRSQITQRWIAEAGIQRPLIQGGYKAARQWLREEIDSFATHHPMLMLSGPTGSAKTHLLCHANSFYPSLDLESIARHRGSAFGGMAMPQPTQIDFENMLALKILSLREAENQKPVLVEDESRLIGRCAVPESFFERMRASSLIYVDEPFDQRVENIFQDYVMQTAIGQGIVSEGLEQFAKYRTAAQSISRKLGGLRTQEILQDLEVAENLFRANPQDLEANKAWIAKLLRYYYDPLYAQSLERRKPAVIFRGDSAEVLKFLRELRG